MATEKKIAELIAAIKTIYPYYANETDVETLVNTWNLLLKDYSDNLVDLALLECLKICKTPPTPADRAVKYIAAGTADTCWKNMGYFN